MGGLGTAGKVETKKYIIEDSIPASHQEQSPEFGAFDHVPSNLDIRGVRIGMSVVHHDRGASIRISIRSLVVGANVFLHGPVLEAIQVNTLAVDFLEFVARVS